MAQLRKQNIIINRVSYNIYYAAINEKSSFYTLSYGHLWMDTQRVVLGFERYLDRINFWSLELPLSFGQG